MPRSGKAAGIVGGVIFALIGLVVTIALLFNFGVIPPVTLPVFGGAATPAATPTPSATNSVDSTNCEISKALATTHPSVGANLRRPSDRSAHSTDCTTVSNPDGTLMGMPVVGGPVGSQTLYNPDTTSNPLTPATFKDIRAKCGQLFTWKALVDCVGDNQWYKDAVNARSSNTGFTWADIVKWAKDPRLKNFSQLTIQVYGGSWTDDQARAIAAKLIGADLAAKLSIVRHPASFVNTYGDGDMKVGNFTDNYNQVRVSLSPVVYDPKTGKPIGLTADSGIFIDCLNIWWLFKWVCTDSSCSPPPCTQTHTCVPPTCTHLCGKDGSVSVGEPQSTGIMGSDSLESGTAGTGTGTSGSIDTSGSLTKDAGSTIIVQGADPTKTQPPAASHDPITTGDKNNPQGTVAKDPDAP